MSEANTPGVSETSPAPVGAVPHQSDTSGMSETQAAALKFVDANRVEIIKGTSNFQLLKQNQEALAHALQGGPVPEWLAPSPDAKAEAVAARTTDERDLPELAAAFTPMQESDIAGLVSRAGIVHQLDREIATEAATVCNTLKLPAAVADGVMARVAHHAESGYGELSDTDRQELGNEYFKSFASPDKAETAARQALAYVISVVGERGAAELEQRAGSLAYDPRIILQLSMLARAKGLA